MTIKSLAVIAAIAAVPFGASSAWSQSSQTLIDAVSAEAVAPAAKGDVEYLNLSKVLRCQAGTFSCTASLNGKKGKQTLITHVSCIAFVSEGMALYGAITAGKFSSVAHAIIPVASRAMDGAREISTVEGPTQVALAQNDKVTIGVAASVAGIQNVICNVTGTITRL